MMNLFGRVLVAVALLSAVVPVTPASAENAGCADLAGLRLPDATVTVAKPVPAGQYTAPNGQKLTVPAFCRVHGLAKPVADSRPTPRSSRTGDTAPCTSPW